jgi:hypothetical protein
MTPIRASTILRTSTVLRTPHRLSSTSPAGETKSPDAHQPHPSKSADAKSSTGSEASKQASEDGSARSGGAQPKILDAAPPARETPDVKAHNEAFEKSHDRTGNWIGVEEGGTGKQP